jgi:hypothetical protein
MKKLMILAAAVVASVAANAAAVEWGAGTITRFDGNTANKNVTGYLFAIAAADYTTYAAMDGETLSKTIYADYSESLSSATVSGTATKKGALNLEGIDAVASTPVYAAVLYIDGVNSDYFLGNVATVNWSGVGTPGISDLANYMFGTTTTPTAWTTAVVPEPTSGLLMLLGMAGLALRRRRA